MFEKTFLDDDRKWILFSIVSGWLFSFGIRLTYPVLVEYVRTDFGISNTIFGLLFTLLMLTYAAMQFPSGMLADHAGEKTVLLLSLLITTTGCVLLTAAPTFYLFALGCIIFGGGTGLYATPQISILTRVFPDRSATAHGIAFASGGIGTALPVIAGFIALHANWRFGFGFVIPFLVLSIVGIGIFAPTRQSKNAGLGGRSITESVFPVLASIRTSAILLPFIVTVLTAFIFQGLTAFLPVYLTSVKGFTTIQATILYGLFFIAGIGFQIVGGNLSDRYKPELVLIAISLASWISLLLLSISSSFITILLIIVPLGAVNALLSLKNTYLVSLLPADVQGGGLGLLRSCIVTFGSSAPVVFGYASDANMLPELMVFSSSIMFVAMLICSYLYKTV